MKGLFVFIFRAAVTIVVTWGLFTIGKETHNGWVGFSSFITGIGGFIWTFRSLGD